MKIIPLRGRIPMIIHLGMDRAEGVNLEPDKKGKFKPMKHHDAKKSQGNQMNHKCQKTFHGRGKFLNPEDSPLDEARHGRQPMPPEKRSKQGSTLQALQTRKASCLTHILQTPEPPR